MPGPAHVELPSKQAPERLVHSSRLDSPSFHTIAILTGGTSRPSEFHLTVIFDHHGGSSLHRSLTSGVTFRRTHDEEHSVDVVLLHEDGPESPSSVTMAGLSATPEGGRLLTKTTLTKGNPEVATTVSNVTPDKISEEDRRILAAIEAGKPLAINS